MNQNPHDDPVIDEIRDLRHRISERFSHDPGGLPPTTLNFKNGNSTIA